MKMKMLVVIGLLPLGLAAQELQLTQFQAGSLISAGEMNGNFSAVKSQIQSVDKDLDELDKRLEKNDASLANLKTEVDQLATDVGALRTDVQGANAEAARANQRLDNMIMSPPGIVGQEYILALPEEGISFRAHSPLYLSQCPSDFEQRAEIYTLGQTSLPVSVTTQLNQIHKDESSYQIASNSHVVFGFEGYCVLTEVADEYEVTKSEFRPVSLLQFATADAIGSVSVGMGVAP